VSETARGRGRYLFAVTRNVSRGGLSGVTGFSEAPLEVVEHRGLQAVVCDVDLTEFGEGALARNLEDLTWLEQVARTHHDVVHAVAATGTAAPMRLVTIYTDDDSVRRRLDEVGDALTESLDRVEGRHEWSVKAYVVPGATPSHPDPEATSGGGAGAAYLQRKRAQADRRRAAGENAARTADLVYDTLARQAVAGRRLTPQDPRLTGRPELMTLNAAYLVGEADAEAFRAAVAEVAETHPDLKVETEGPWPPYSFATLE
jgi:hypothetical protein